ncbi:MAG: LPS export ABC transporter permease LptG [Bdellovibrionia bacterium]
MNRLISGFMKTLDRYVLGIFIKNLMVALLGLGALFFFQSIFTDLYNQNHQAKQILYYHALSIPQILVQMSPPAVLMATVLTLSGLSRTGELVACYSIGYGVQALMVRILAAVLVVCCFILVLEDRILPPFHRKKTSYFWREMERRPDFFLDIKSDKVWYRSKNMIYNLRLFDAASKMIHGMTLYTFDEQFNLLQVVDAEKAVFVGKSWKLQNGIVTLFSKDHLFPLSQRFIEKNVVIAETPKDFQEIEKEVDALRFKELKQYIQRMKQAGGDTKSFEVKYHARYSVSFLALVFCLLAIPFSLSSRRQEGLARDLVICLILTFFYWLFFSVSLSLGSKGAMPPWLAAWLPSFIFMILGATLIARRVE